MLTHPTIEHLHAMHLAAMAQAFDQQRGSPPHAALPFDDRFGLLVDAEWTAREQRRLTQRLRNARLRYPASLEDVDFTTPRGLPRDVVLSLGTGAWIREHHNLLLTGPTGIGKSWLACAFVESACRHGFTATYVRAPRLLHELAVSRGDGSDVRLLAKWAKLDLLAIDDWLLAPLTDAERRDLLEVIEDRSERAATLIASQLPPTAWHAAIGEPSVADAICDRLIHRAHKLALKGPTMRGPDTRRPDKGKS
jgi:DNA replication protein DnaC